MQTTLAKGEIYTTLEVKVNLVRAITKDTGLVRATGRLIHRGRTTGTAEGDIRDARGQPARARHHDVHDFPGEEISARRRDRYGAMLGADRGLLDRREAARRSPAWSAPRPASHAAASRPRRIDRVIAAAGSGADRTAVHRRLVDRRAA